MSVRSSYCSLSEGREAKFLDATYYGKNAVKTIPVNTRVENLGSRVASLFQITESQFKIQLKPTGIRSVEPRGILSLLGCCCGAKKIGYYVRGEVFKGKQKVGDISDQDEDVFEIGRENFTFLRHEDIGIQSVVLTYQIPKEEP